MALYKLEFLCRYCTGLEVARGGRSYSPLCLYHPGCYFFCAHNLCSNWCMQLCVTPPKMLDYPSSYHGRHHFLAPRFESDLGDVCFTSWALKVAIFLRLELTLFFKKKSDPRFF